MNEANMTDEELKSEILKCVRQININDAVNTSPVYGLSDILALRNVTSLRRLGRLLSIQYYGKLKKEQLISAIQEKLQETNTLCLFLYNINDMEWNLFCDTVAVKHLKSHMFNFEAYRVLKMMALIELFYDQDTFWLVVPEEIKTAYKKLSQTNFHEKKNFQILCNNYVLAAVSLYGVISYVDFVDLFNSQNERQIDIKEMINILFPFTNSEYKYFSTNNYFIHEDFYEDDFEEIQDLLKAQSVKPRYTPSKHEFLKYAYDDYYEITPQIRQLKGAISELISDEDTVWDITDNVHDICAMEGSPQEFFNLLDAHNVVFDSEEQFRNMLVLFIDVCNHTRLWTNNGYTPNELSIIMRPAAQTERPQRVGRNDPCPCGSGKKYKKCCGK